MPRLRPLFALFLTGAAHAADGPALPAGEFTFLQELPIVLTPSRLPQPLSEAPAAVTVIDRELIRATGYRDLARLLRLVPGMQIGQERGNSHWVTYHGLSNNYPSWIQVLVDGRSVFSPGNFGGVDWAGLPVTLDEIERIEVVRGTDTVAYGANAFLGVINIITRHSADDPGMRATLNAGNADIRDLALEAGGSPDWGGLRLNAQLKSDTGFEGLHDSQRFRILSLRADRRLGPRDEVMFRLAGNLGTRQSGYPDSTYGNNAERSADSRNTTLHLQWRHVPQADAEWLLHYYRNQDRVREAWLACAAPMAPHICADLDRHRDSVRDSLELQHRLTLTETLRAVWGLEARHDRVDSPFLFHGDARQSEDLGRLFGNLEWQFMPAWSLNLGAMAEKPDGSPPRFSPRAFVNWQASPTDTLRAGYARAWRQPTLFERHGDVRAHDRSTGVLLAHPYLPHPDLSPARMDSVEVGYLGQFRPGNTRLDLRLFAERIRDYIHHVSHPELQGTLLLPPARYDNLDSPVTLRGIEYQLDARPLPGARILFTHSIVDASSDDPIVSTLTAPYTASLTWIQDWGRGWSSTLTALRMGPLAGGEGFVAGYQYTSRPYTTYDARVGYATRLGGTPAQIALSATNLGGRHQEIADRSEQFIHGTEPVNRTSPMVWLTLSLNPI